MTEKIANRRHFLAATGAVLAAPYVRAQARKTVKVSVGRQPWAAGNSPVTQYMITNKTYERFASQLGYDLTVDYRGVENAATIVNHRIANDFYPAGLRIDFDFGDMGAAGKRCRLNLEVARGVESRRYTAGKRKADAAVDGPRELTQASFEMRHALDAHLAIMKFEIVDAGFHQG